MLLHSRTVLLSPFYKKRRDLCSAQTKLLTCPTPVEIRGMWIRGTEQLGLRLFAPTLMGHLQQTQQLPFSSIPCFSYHLPARCFNNSFTTWARVICVVLNANGTIKKKKTFLPLTILYIPHICFCWHPLGNKDELYPWHLYGKNIILI